MMKKKRDKNWNSLLAWKIEGGQSEKKDYSNPHWWMFWFIERFIRASIDRGLRGGGIYRGIWSQI